MYYEMSMYYLIVILTVCFPIGQINNNNNNNKLNDYFVYIGKKISETFSNHDLSWNHPESIHTFVLKSISPGKT